jgi:hypothetical protein
LSDSDIERKQQFMLLSSCLDLVENVLCFDFLGMEPRLHYLSLGNTLDDSTDGMTVIYAPTSWEQLFVNHPMSLFFNIYETFPPPYSLKV